MPAMGVRRYSRDPDIERRQRQFDELQARCDVDYYAPEICELIAIGVRRAYWQCRDYACLHESRSTPFALDALPPKKRTHTLRRQFYCSACGTRRPKFRMIWDG